MSSLRCFINSALHESPASRRISVEDLLLLVLLSAYGVIGLWNFEVNMATLHEDDNPVFYALAYKDPSLFAGDYPIGIPVSLLVPLKVATSAMVWVPAILWRHLDVDPFLATGLLTLLQGVLLGLSVYVFTTCVVGRKDVAFLATLFAYSASPWTWAPVNYGNGSLYHFVPYAATLATSLVLFSFASILKRREIMGLVLLTAAGLFHPGVTLHAAVILMLFYLFQGVGNSPALQTLGRLGGVAAVVIVIVMPSLWIQATVDFEPLDAAETIAGMKHNQHLWPWDFKARWYPALAAMLSWALFALLSLRERLACTESARMLLVSALAGACLMGMSHVIGGILELPFLLNLVGLRSFRWFALLALPLIIHYLYDHLLSADLIGCLSALICLTLPLFTLEYASIWFLPLALCFLFLDARKGQVAGFRVNVATKTNSSFAVLATVAWLVWVFLYFSIYRIQELSPGSVQDPISQVIWAFGLPHAMVRLAILVLCICSGVYFWHTAGRGRSTPSTEQHSRAPGPAAERIDHGRSPSAIALMTACCALFLLIQSRMATGPLAAESRASLDAQLWAKRNTPASSLFVVPSGGWRAISERRKLDPFTRESYAYLAPRAAKEHRDRLLRFYGISEEDGVRLRGTGPGSVYEIQRARFFAHTEKEYRQFVSAFGATHLILPVRHSKERTNAPLLPVAYCNKHYVIYELSAESGLDSAHKTPSTHMVALPLPVTVRPGVEPIFS